ncbi:MAG TPA: Fe-S cluster assembly protein SufD [Planctomycetota bacterium]
MTALLQGVEAWTAEFGRVAASLPGFPELRRRAITRFADLGFPTGREEAWRFTDLSALAETAFRPAGGTANPAQFAALAKGPLKACQVAFVDGRYAPQFSSLDLPPGVRVTTLATVLQEDPKRAEPYLGGLAPADRNPFTALNTAFMTDGAFVHVSRDVKAERPIHVLFLSSFHGDPYVTYPRLLVVLEEGASAVVAESHLGPAGGTYFTNAAAEVYLAPGASLELCKVQRESREAFHVASMEARIGRDASFVHHSISFGAKIARNDFGAVLADEGAEVELNGLFEVGGQQLADHHTSIDHAAPRTSSRELYKGILDGRGRGVFDGRILVRPRAQKTNANQSSKNLLLSNEAVVHTKPQLEILANDVKCKHGATIGQLDRDKLFYMRSRGLGLEEARRLLIHAFASEIIDHVKIDAVRAQVGGCLGLMTHV